MQKQKFSKKKCFIEYPFNFNKILEISIFLQLSKIININFLKFEKKSIN